MTTTKHPPGRPSEEWDEYFTSEDRGLFQRLLMFHRRRFVAPATAHHFDRVFPDSGVFLEAGAGTSESSGKISGRDRQLLAFDISYVVLHRFNVLPVHVQGDIRALPFSDGSVAGIWNLGVMEHFSDVELQRVLGEFNRVLEAKGRILLFWPPWYALHEIVLNSLAWLARVFLGRNIEFFPDEVNLYSSRRWVARILDGAGFDLVKTSFGWRDLFSYVVVVACKRSSVRASEES